jgi:hypothetical protein
VNGSIPHLGEFLFARWAVSLSCTPEGFMYTPDVEEEIKKLEPELSKIYFKAKEELTKSQDSRSERFSFAARIVKAFWKRVHALKTQS